MTFAAGGVTTGRDGGAGGAGGARDAVECPAITLREPSPTIARSSTGDSRRVGGGGGGGFAGGLSSATDVNSIELPA